MIIFDCTGLEKKFFKVGNAIIPKRRYDEVYTEWKPVKSGI